eukprot:TRINITY_DN9347_c0_g1_i1.p1 TRINITY_DN9347_c0_g1~~TRINITY_DN9347_c0_g1_i1.p1  ORF type:complete len:284 (-),score=66.82 TRINITY_DN9347_c0_g1_i1:54-905(-)
MNEYNVHMLLDAKQDVKSLIVLDGKQKVKDALQQMKEEKIHSAPVKIGEDNWKYVDLLDFIMASLKDPQNALDQNLEEICNTSGKSCINHIEKSKTLFTAVKMLTESGHLVVSHDFKSAPSGVLGAHDIIEFAFSHQDVLPKHIRDLPVKSLIQKGDPDVASLKEKMGDALKRCVDEKRHHGFGVTNEEGNLIGVLSVSDLDHISLQDAQQTFESTVEDFLEKLKKDRTPRVVNEEGTLDEAIQIMKAEKIYRVFVVNKDSKPIGVITCSDVMRAVVDHPSSS